MTREAQNALLLLVGLSTGIITVSGAFTRYVKPALEPWLMASAALLTVLALASIVRDVRRGPHQETHDDHGHHTGVIWLLVVPVALLAFIVPPAIGPQTARRSEARVSTEALRRPFPPLPDQRAPELSLPDLLIRNAQDSAGTLKDRLVTVTGFTMRDGDRTALGRVVIICCAADAQLAQITLGGPAAAQAAQLPEGSWVRVEGTIPAGQSDSTQNVIPTIDISAVEQIEPPENSYTY